MSRHILSLSPEQLTAFDLDAFIAHAEALNQHHRDTFTPPLPSVARDRHLEAVPCFKPLRQAAAGR